MKLSNKTGSLYLHVFNCRKRFPVFIGAQRILENDLVVGGYRIPKQVCYKVLLGDTEFQKRYATKYCQGIQNSNTGMLQSIARGYRIPNQVCYKVLLGDTEFQNRYVTKYCQGIQNSKTGMLQSITRGYRIPKQICYKVLLGDTEFQNRYVTTHYQIKLK